MKSVIFAAAIGFCLATTAHAGGMAPPVMAMDPVVIEDTTAGSSSSAGLIIPLILIALVAVALSSNNGGEGGQLSDARLKTDIVPVGTTASGLPLYHFRYIGQSTVYQGVMAQDVLRVQPDAVVTGWDGFYRVNYSALGLRMTEVN